MKNMNKYQRFYYSMRSWLNVINEDIHSGVKLGFFNRIKMWQKGFSSEKYYFYDLANNDSRWYVSDRDRAKSRFINEPFSEVLNNKLVFEKMLSREIKVPTNYALIDCGKAILLVDEPDLDTEGGLTAFDVVNHFCKEKGKVVLKPVKGAFGRGVIVLSCPAKDHYRLNLNDYSSESLKELLKVLDNVLVSEFIEQGEHPRHLYPKATNTLRVLTLAPPDGGLPFIAAAARRIGTQQSAPLDNNAQGGMTVHVCLNSGRMGRAAQLTKKGLVWHEQHPESGAQINGVSIPDWDMIKTEILYIAGRIPFLKYVGWDVVETDNGLVFLEGNNHANVRVLQIHRPLLREEQIAVFFKYHRII